MAAGKTVVASKAAAPSKTRIFVARGERIHAIHLSPQLIAAFSLSLVVFAVLSIGGAAYLVLHDEPLPDSKNEQTAIAESYEDRIAALRTEIDRITSRGLVDHANVEQKVDRLLDRQTALDARQAMLARLTDAARKAGLDVPVPSASAEPGASASVPPAAAPTAEPTVDFGDMGLRSETATPPTANDRIAAADRIANIDDRLETIGDEQMKVVGSMAGKVASRADKIAAVLKRLGRSVPNDDEDAVGGPFVPIPAGTDDAAFKAGVGTLAEQFDRLAALRKIALSLPLKPPLKDASISSGFGPRLDPFLGQLAMHTGIDFRALQGTPARAVAAGTIIAAEYNGGYGNMIDIDHGQGIVTRYGHLSEIDVHVGDKVAAGGLIGRIGATGRATGPHLHYEIRVNGTAIDPMRYLKAGQDIVAWL